MNISEIKSLLIFRPGHLGDTIVALPAIWRLRLNLPQVEISYLYNVDHQNPHFITPREVLEEIGLIDHWIEYPFFEGQGAVSRAMSRAALLLKLRRLRFDAVAYLMPRERTLKQIERDKRFFGSAGIREFIGIDRLIQGRFEINDLPASERITSESDFLTDCVSDDDFETTEIKDHDLFKISDAELQQVRSLIEFADDSDSKRTLVAIAPGSKRSSRMWNEDRFAHIVDQLVRTRDLFPIFFGSSGEQELCERIKSIAGAGFNGAGLLSIRQSAALLKTCLFYLGNDTGTMHLAAAVGTPCVAIFSAADRNGQWEPFGDGHRFLRQSVDCEGCRVDVCPRQNLCLQLIETEDVYNACVEVIDQNRKR